MWFSGNRKKPKNISSNQKTDAKNKVGKNISVSSWNNSDIKQHIGAKEDTVLSTEHLKYTKLTKKENEKEKKKESFSFFRKKAKTAEENIEKISYIELDTGTIEIGYDKKTNEVVLTFMYDTKREEINDAKVKNENEKVKEESQIENRGFEPGKKVITIYGNITAGGNIKKSGTVTVRCDKNNILESIRKELYSGMKYDGKSSGNRIPRYDNFNLIEKVIPFSNTNYEAERRKEISQEKSYIQTNRSNMHTAMTVLQNVEAAKKYKEMQLSRCFQEASETAEEYKTGSGKKVITYDEYYLKMLRKQKAKSVVTAVGAVAGVAAVAGAAVGIEVDLKSKKNNKTSIFDKIGGTEQDIDIIEDEKIIEADNENYFDENINKEEQEDEITDRENYEDEYEENEDENLDSEENNEDNDEYEDDDEEDDEEDDDEYEDDDEDDDEDGDEDEEEDNDGDIEEEEYGENEESENNGQEDSEINQADNLRNNINENFNKTKKKKRRTRNKTVNQSEKLSTETNNEDNVTQEAEDESKNLTQDSKKINNDENKSGDESNVNNDNVDGKQRI